MTVWIAKHDGRYWLKLLRYDQDLIDAIKQWFPTRRRGWDARRRLWWVDQSQADGLASMLAWHQCDVRHVGYELIIPTEKRVTA